MSVVAIAMALVLPIVMGNRRVVQLDQARTSANQTLRASQQLLAGDVRVAGERFGLGLNLSPIELSRDGNGNAVLVLRRNLEDALPVCEAVSGSQTDLQVADWSGAAPQQCAVNRTTEDGGVSWPSTLHAHRQAAEAAGGTVAAYIFDPSTRTGQWFAMRVPAAQGAQPDEVRCDASAPAPLSCAWDAAAAYGPTSASYIAILEETIYRLTDGVLERVDGATGEALRIASGIESFQVTATFEDGTTRTTIPGDADWRAIEALNLDLAAARREGRNDVRRTLQTSLFPRNLLSR